MVKRGKRVKKGVGRPRGGKAPPSLRKYWREQKAKQRRKKKKR